MQRLIPPSVLQKYAFGIVKNITPISTGLIHQTFGVETDQGHYIMQRLHPLLSSDQIGQDFLAVTQYLEAQQFPAPRCVLTKSGCVLAHQGKLVWRTQTFLKGQVFDRMPSVRHAQEAGALLARFHRTLDSITHTFQTPLVWFDTEKRYREFLETLKKYQRSPLTQEVHEEVELIKKNLPTCFMPKRVRTRVIHGDPKISNFLFDTSGKAVAILDLDLCQRRPLPLELGDAFRSWCGLEEDDPYNRFRMDIFRAGLRGYMGQAKGFITKQEIDLIPRGTAAVTLELASRFLKDYFEDHYFGWNEKKYPSRRAHNLARTRGMIALYKDLQKNKHLQE